MSRPPRISFPDGKEFAFTILDDTDDTTVENGRPIYDLLHELGLRTTKTVWPVACPEGSDIYFAGQTMAEPSYREWALELQRRGFEITWHDATMESSRRERTVQGLEAFRDAFGDWPRLHPNHGQNRENIYWGGRRYLNPLLRWALDANFRRQGIVFEGEREDSPYFWGDLCRAHVRYVRNFTFREIDTLKADPWMVYRARHTPYVNAWFTTSDAPDAAAFRRLVTPAAVDRLRAQGGVCIVSTHLGKRFVRDGRVDPGVEDALRHVASLPGWFVPVTPLLDHLSTFMPAGFRPARSILALELRHALDRLG